MKISKPFKKYTAGVGTLQDPLSVAAVARTAGGALVETLSPAKLSTGLFEVETDDDLYEAETAYKIVWTYTMAAGHEQTFEQAFTTGAGGGGGGTEITVALPISVEVQPQGITVEVTIA